MNSFPLNNWPIIFCIIDDLLVCASKASGESNIVKCNSSAACGASLHSQRDKDELLLRACLPLTAQTARNLLSISDDFNSAGDRAAAQNYRSCGFKSLSAVCWILPAPFASKIAQVRCINETLHVRLVSFIITGHIPRSTLSNQNSVGSISRSLSATAAL